MDPTAKARRFQELHRGPRILVVMNAWDAASARVFEEAGAQAVGTGSAGIAFSHGYPDNDRIPKKVILDATREIVDAVDVPVTADILTGLGNTVEEVVETVKQVIAMGAVGINVEDATDEGPRLFDIDRQVEKVAAIAQAVKAAGVPIVVNARTDSYWLKIGDATAQLRASIERANRYREAGADCLFVPAVSDKVAIRTLVQEIQGPVNILSVPGCPPIPELEQLGVRRVSEGSGPMRAAMGLARRIAQELLATGTYKSFHEGAIPYPEANKLFE
jgi:2-methylisocitrate lyase-like PEP mutase family enzyme